MNWNIRILESSRAYALSDRPLIFLGAVWAWFGSQVSCLKVMSLNLYSKVRGRIPLHMPHIRRIRSSSYIRPGHPLVRKRF